MVCESVVPFRSDLARHVPCVYLKLKIRLCAARHRSNQRDAVNLCIVEARPPAVRGNDTLEVLEMLERLHFDEG